MVREYEISERIFDLPVPEQGPMRRLTELLTGLHDSDEAGGRGNAGRSIGHAASSIPPG